MKQMDHDIVVIIASAMIVLLILLVFLISFLIIYHNKQIKNETAIREINQKYEQELLQAQLEIQEQTLKSISEEIHDNMGQVLSLVVLNLSSIELRASEADQYKIGKSIDLVQKVVNDLRNLSKTLDPDNIVNAGIVNLVKYELDALQKTGYYNTSFQQNGNMYSLDARQTIIIFRIVQEALNNIIKHAQAKEVNVVVAFGQATMSLEVTDDGIGIGSDTYPNKQVHKGAGLENMKRRAGLIGSTLHINKGPAGGTQITLTVPVSQ